MCLSYAGVVRVEFWTVNEASVFRRIDVPGSPVSTAAPAFVPIKV